jgi:tetratricopeptide (TPR) repeat protein
MLCVYAFSVLILLGTSLRGAQRATREPLNPIPLRLTITVDGDATKAAHVSVELMDAVGSGSAMADRVTDNDGRVDFVAYAGLHRIRISGPGIQRYDGEIEILPSEISHVERIRVHAAETRQQAAESPPMGVVPAMRLRIPEGARRAFQRGTEAMQKQLWEKSRASFEAAIREYPQYDMAYNGLGLVQMQLNQIEAARQSFSKALELNPDYAGANRNLARILLSEHKVAEALPLLERSLAAEPDNVWALTNAANSEFLLHDFANAIQYARKAHALPHQAFPIVHIIAARSLEATAQPAQALEEYRLYLQEDPKDPDAKRAQEAVARLSKAQPP